MLPNNAGRMNQAGAAAGTSDTPSPTTNPFRTAPRRPVAAAGYGGAPRAGGYGQLRPALPPAAAPVTTTSPMRPATGGGYQAQPGPGQMRPRNPFMGGAPAGGPTPKTSPYPQDQEGTWTIPSYGQKPQWMPSGGGVPVHPIGPGFEQPGRGRPVQGQAGVGYDGPRPNDTRTPGELMDAYNRMQGQQPHGQMDLGMYDQYRNMMGPK